MRKIIAILCIVLPGYLAAQPNLAKTRADSLFIYSYGGVNLDEFRAIKELPGGNCIAAGTSASFGQGNTSVYLVKTDALGKHVWSGIYGGGQNDWAYSVEVTSDSGYFVTGFSNSFGTQGYQGYLLRTDKNGDALWQKTVGGDDWDFIYGSTRMPSGGYLLCGTTYSNSHGGSDAWLVRVNDNGDTLWTHTYGGLFDEGFNKVAVLNDQIYVVGTNNTHPADTVMDGWIVKLDTNGNLLNEKFISNSCASCHHFGENLRGITPYNATSLTFCGSVDQPDSGAVSSILGRIDTALNYQWIDMWVPASQGTYEVYEQVINISYGSICAIGTKEAGLGGTGLFLVGFDNTAQYINDFSPTDGGSMDDAGYAAILTSAGRVIGVGSTQSTAEYCGNTSTANDDAFLVRYNTDSICSLGVVPRYFCFADTMPLWHVDVPQFPDEHITLYPNPANERCQLQILGQNAEEYRAAIYSVLGEELLSISMKNNSEKDLDVSQLQPGVHYLKVFKAGATVTVIKFIIVH